MKEECWTKVQKCLANDRESYKGKSTPSSQVKTRSQETEIKAETASLVALDHHLENISLCYKESATIYFRELYETREGRAAQLSFYYKISPKSCTQPTKCSSSGGVVKYPTV